jgi:hypothetical protein
MELEGEDPFFRSFGCFVGDIDGGLAIDELLDVISSDDDAVFVPIVFFDARLDLSTLARFASDLDFRLRRAFALSQGDFLAALGEDATASFLIEDSAILIAVFQICLIAGNDEIFLIDDLTAELETAVDEAFVISGLHFVFQREFKVSHFARPDQEGIRGGGLLDGSATGDHTVLDRPEIWISFPTREVLTVEKCVFFGMGDGYSEAQNQEDFHGLQATWEIQRLFRANSRAINRPVAMIHTLPDRCESTIPVFHDLFDTVD